LDGRFQGSESRLQPVPDVTRRQNELLDFGGEWARESTSALPYPSGSDRVSNVMADVVTVSIHRSQFPDAVRQSLLTSIRTRRINPKFHYDGTRQTLRWLALHEALSPSRSNPDCRQVYTQAFDYLVQATTAPDLDVIGLGCGGGWKEAELIRRLRGAGRSCVYFPVDVSVAMVVVASRTAQWEAPECRCHPLVTDLSEVDGLDGWSGESPREGPRLITCFGLLPNFEPPVIGARLRSLVRPGDLLAVSANLAPCAGGRGDVESILPQYDNVPTRDWLMGLMSDVGFCAGDGALQFKVEKSGEEPGLWRIAVDFVLGSPKSVEVEGHHFDFSMGDSFRVFFSYRYTPAQVESLLAAHGLSVRESWVSPTGEEGVFVCAQTSRDDTGQRLADATSE
jgi:uncharacterized SAM-dependent methyltransferase